MYLEMTSHHVKRYIQTHGLQPRQWNRTEKVTESLPYIKWSTGTISFNDGLLCPELAQMYQALSLWLYSCLTRWYFSGFWSKLSSSDHSYVALNSCHEFSLQGVYLWNMAELLIKGERNKLQNPACWKGPGLDMLLSRVNTRNSKGSVGPFSPKC